MLQTSKSIFLLNSLWDIFIGNNIFGLPIIIIITASLGISFYVFFREWSRLSQENGCLSNVKRTLRNLSRGGNLDDEDIINFEINYDEVIEEIERIPLEPLIKLNEHHEESIINQRLLILQKNQETRTKINVGYLKDISELREEENWESKFPRFVMTVAMLMGMLGTFIGLTIMVGEIADQVDASQRAIQSGSGEGFLDSITQIKGIIGGVGTAFTTTLFGLSTTIIVTLLNFLLSQKKVRFFAELESFTMEELLPKTFGGDIEEKTMLETVEDHLEDLYKRVNNSLEENSKAIDSITGLYTQFEVLEKTLRDVMTQGATNEVQEVVAELNTMNQQVKLMIDKYQNKQLLEDFKGLTEVHKEYISKANNLIIETKWVPDTKTFMMVIAGLLAVIALFLGISVFR